MNPPRVDPLVTAIAQLLARHHAGCNQPAPWMTTAATELVDCMHCIGWNWGWWKDGIDMAVTVSELAPEINRRNQPSAVQHD